MSESVVTVYVDGACRGNPGYGGAGAVLQKGQHKKELTAYAVSTTNNKMELTAAIIALSALKKPCKVELYSDSKYLVTGMNEWIGNWIKRGWRVSAGSHVSNKELWQELVKLSEIHTVSWNWIPREKNTEADALANKGCDQALVELNKIENYSGKGKG